MPFSHSHTDHKPLCYETELLIKNIHILAEQ